MTRRRSYACKLMMTWSMLRRSASGSCNATTASPMTTRGGLEALPIPTVGVVAGAEVEGWGIGEAEGARVGGMTGFARGHARGRSRQRCEMPPSRRRLGHSARETCWECHAGKGGVHAKARNRRQCYEGSWVESRGGDVEASPFGFIIMKIYESVGLHRISCTGFDFIARPRSTTPR